MVRSDRIELASDHYFDSWYFFMLYGFIYNDKKHRKTRKYGYTFGDILLALLKELPWYFTSIFSIVIGLVLIIVAIFIITN